MKQTQNINQLVEHFFRHESGMMVAVLTKAKDNPIFNDIPTKIEVHPMMPVGGN